MDITTPDNTVIHISKKLRDKLNHIKLIMGCTQEKVIDNDIDVMIEHGVTPAGKSIKLVLGGIIKLEKGNQDEREI